MIFFTFSEILKTILITSKSNGKNTGWVKQEVIVNSIFSFLNIPGKKDEEFYINISDCSKYFNSKKISLKKLKNT